MVILVGCCTNALGAIHRRSVGLKHVHNEQKDYRLFYEKGKALNSNATMTPEKRERYARWLRDTGVEHPSDELIDRTRERALSLIDTAKEQKRRNNLKLVTLLFCLLVAAACVWVRL
jgi:hypothetical protein